MNFLTGGIGTILRGFIVCCASGLLSKYWMVATQFIFGVALMVLGAFRVDKERQQAQTD
jgi:hypothetical protein